MSSSEKILSSSPLPTWGKVLIGLFIAGVVLVFAGIGLVSYIVADSGNPQRVEAIMQSIAKIEKMPPGWKYERGLQLPRGGSVVFLTYKDGTNLSLMKFPNPAGADARAIADKISKAEVKQGPQLEVQKEDRLSVAGQDFEYVLGVVPVQGRRIEQLRGAVVVNNKKDVVTVTASNPTGQLNLDAIKAFLESIKGL